MLTRVKSDLPSHIKKLIRLVNSESGDVEANYQKLRKLQGLLANELVLAANGAAIRLTPEMLKLLNKLDFPTRQTIRVRKYAIECDGLKTTAWNVKTFRDLCRKDMPQYLRDFM